MGFVADAVAAEPASRFVPDAEPPPAKPRAGAGVWDALVAGYQSSATGLIVRRQLPDVVLDHHNSTWYEKALESLSSTFSEIPEMALGHALGTPVGAAAGGSIAGPPGAVVGGVLAGGAGAMAVPTLIRESLVQAYSSGEADSSADWLTRTGIVLKATAKSGVVGALTMGAGALVSRTTGNILGPLAGQAITGGAAARAALTAGTTAEVGTMVVSSAALEGRLPEPQDFANAAIVIGGMKAAGRISQKVADIYARTGRRPEEVVADAKADPQIKADLADVSRGTLPRAYEPLAAAETARNAVPGHAQEVLDSPFAALPEAKLPTQINLKSVDGPDQVKAVLTRMSEVYQEETQAQRGGTQGWADTEAKAQTALNDLTGGEAAKVVTAREPGTAANAVELKIRGDMLMQASIEAAAAIKKFNEAKAAGTATDQMKLDALASIHRAAMIQAEFTGAAAETARALQYMQKIKEAREQSGKIKELVDLYGKDPEMLLRMAGDIDTPAGMAKFAKDAAKATKWEMVIEAYKAGLIGPISQVANVLGNLTFAGVHVVVDVATALRPGGDVKMAQVVAGVVGQFQGAYEGLVVASRFTNEVWKNSVESAVRTAKEADLRHPIESVVKPLYNAAMEPLRKLDEGPAVKQEQHRKAIPGDLGVLVRSLSFPWLSAMDGAFRMIEERKQTNSWATGQAIKEGFSPLTREGRTRIADLAQNVPVEQQVKIAAYGTRAVFQDRLNPWMQDMQSLITRSKVGPLFIPYVQTPTNVFKELARFTPAAPFVDAWKADFKEGGAARDRAIAEIVVGSSLFAVTATLANDGERITGYGPPDHDKRAAWMETHQPYSVKILGKYYDYSRIQPIGTLVGLAADMSSIWKHMTPDEQDKLPKMISIAFSQAVTNQVWLRGMVDLMRGVAEAERYGPKIAQNLAGGLVPASGWLGQTAQLMDPYVREVNSIMDAIRNKIPGVRESLEPKISGLTGKEIENPERLGVVSPIKVKEESDDKVLLEAARLSVGVANAPKHIELPSLDKKIGRVPLTPEQRSIFSRASGKIAHESLSMIVGTPMWDTLPPLVQRKVFTNVLEDARKIGRAEALPAEQRALEATRIAAELWRKLEPK